MKIKLFLAILLLGSLIGCNKENARPNLPNQDFIIVDPDRTPELNLKKVEVQVWNQERLAKEAADKSNKDQVWYVFTAEQIRNLYSNLVDASDVLAKSIESNQYYRKAIGDYRADKKTVEVETSVKKKDVKK